MTSEQIKDLIASKIAGQGNQVDSGGALSTILNAIVDAVADASKPIVTSGILQPGENHQTDLDNIGLTVDEIQAAAEGEDSVNITWEDAQKLIGLPIS